MKVIGHGVPPGVACEVDDSLSILLDLGPWLRTGLKRQPGLGHARKGRSGCEVRTSHDDEASRLSRSPFVEIDLDPTLNIGRCVRGAPAVPARMARRVSMYASRRLARFVTLTKKFFVQPEFILTGRTLANAENPCIGLVAPHSLPLGLVRSSETEVPPDDLRITGSNQ